MNEFRRESAKIGDIFIVIDNILKGEEYHSYPIDGEVELIRFGTNKLNLFRKPNTDRRRESQWIFMHHLKAKK